MTTPLMLLLGIYVAGAWLVMLGNAYFAEHPADDVARFDVYIVAIIWPLWFVLGAAWFVLCVPYRIGRILRLGWRGAWKELTRG